MQSQVKVKREEIQIPLSRKRGVIGAFFSLPENPKGVVLFAHGSGSSRFSLRNQMVAEMLNQRLFATLLVDLLTKEEGNIDDQTRALRFDLPLLEERVRESSQWLLNYPASSALPLGYFGASTGAAAALAASLPMGDQVKAIVSRGGRPDLAGKLLQKVTVPTLLIVGGSDYGVIELNEQAFNQLSGEKKLAIVPGVTHLFEEHGALEEVAKLSSDWFDKYL